MRRWGIAAAMIIGFHTANADEMTGCDTETGKQVFQKCAVCHSLEQDAAHGVGPNLHGIAGRPVGKIDGFKFSKRMRESAESWTDEHLDAFLKNPAEVYLRTRMAFGGLEKRRGPCGPDLLSDSELIRDGPQPKL